MEIFPAIDLKGGQVVRLTQGDFSKIKVYAKKPAAAAARFAAEGARNLHIVDLDGARDGTNSNIDTIRDIVAMEGLFVQVGGGIRDEARVDTYMALGVGRVILGTAAVEDFGFLEKMVKKYGARIGVSVDARDGRAAYRGWQSDSGLDSVEFCKKLETAGVSTIVYTDISRDGLMQGANLEIYRTLKNILTCNIIASGGVGKEDVAALREMGIYGVIIGKALYENTLSLAGLTGGIPAKRIIPCLDIRGGKVVKGVKFENIRDVSDPVEAAAFYNSQGADEIVFYDIAASTEGRGLFDDLLRRVASQVTVPLMAGGGIASLNDVERALSCGADKVSINSGAIKDPGLIEQAAREYGSRRVALSMDVKKSDGVFRVFSRGGSADTGIDAPQWARRGQESGAGELVINSIEADGVKGGFDTEMLRAIREASSLPIVASGGAGEARHFLELFRQTDVEAGLAASVFHFREVEIPRLKEYLKENGIPVNV